MKVPDSPHQHQPGCSQLELFVSQTGGFRRCPHFSVHNCSQNARDSGTSFRSSSWSTVHGLCWWLRIELQNAHNCHARGWKMRTPYCYNISILGTPRAGLTSPTPYQVLCMTRYFVSPGKACRAVASPNLLTRKSFFSSSWLLKPLGTRRLRRMRQCRQCRQNSIAPTQIHALGADRTYYLM
jgi:hypothetical protein